MKLCLNCLRYGHFIVNCRSSACQRCHSRHHTLLHIDAARGAPPQLATQPEVHSSEQTVNLSASNSPRSARVLLSTVAVYAFDRNNRRHLVRALLDPGSQSSFITSDLGEILQLPEQEISVTVAGINETQSEVKYSSSVTIRSGCNAFSTSVSCLIIPQIASNLPNFTVDVSKLKVPAHIRLADPKFNVPGRIDMLLGADCFWQFLCVGQIRPDPDGPVLQNTRFGWIVSGPIQSCALFRTYCNFARDYENRIDKQISRFWDIETFSDSKPLSQIEKHPTHWVILIMLPKNV